MVMLLYDIGIEGESVMPKTEEELKELKKECEEVGKKLEELSEDELEKVTGGFRRLTEDARFR